MNLAYIKSSSRVFKGTVRIEHYLSSGFQNMAPGSASPVLHENISQMQAFRLCPIPSESDTKE